MFQMWWKHNKVIFANFLPSPTVKKNKNRSTFSESYERIRSWVFFDAQCTTLQQMPELAFKAVTHAYNLLPVQ